MSVFRFKQFSIQQEKSAMKVGTDAMVLGALVRSVNPRKILDIGSGTGVLALMMAQKFPKAKIEAIELDAAAFQESEANFQNSPWNERLRAIHANFLSFEFGQTFDLIVSNPPYYQTKNTNEDARKSQARHEFSLPVQAMLEKVSTLLSSQGAFWVIVPSEVISNWTHYALSFGLHNTAMIAVHGKETGPVKRVILVFQKVTQAPTESSISIRNSKGKYTKEYKALTLDFHYNSLD